jgi:hypothetical protein
MGENLVTNAADDALLTKLNEAVAEVNKAQRAHEATHAELVSKSKVVGQLLLEAKKRHPKDFVAFLKRVQGLSLSRAYDCMKVAGGRATDEQLREETRERVRKHRAKKKLPKPEPKPVSVTDPDVTESPKQIPPRDRITQSPEISAEQRRAENARLDHDDNQAAKTSARALTEFTVACRTWLPKITVEADRQEARNLVATLTCSKSREAA